MLADTIFARFLRFAKAGRCLFYYYFNFSPTLSLFLSLPSLSLFYFFNVFFFFLFFFPPSVLSSSFKQWAPSLCFLSASLEFAIISQKGAYTLVWNPDFETVTQGTPPDRLVWWPTGFTLVVHKIVYVHLL